MGLNKVKIIAVMGLLCFSSAFAVSARQMESLGRGLIAAKAPSGMLVSWRLLGTDSPTATFTLYRDGSQIASISSTAPTTYLDASGTTTSTYTLKDASGNVSSATMVLDGYYKDSYGSAAYKSISLSKPAGVTTPDGVTCFYVPNDMSVGDLDGDGEYELIVKWYPSNAQDNANAGYTGNIYIDAYKLNGTKLWRIDLGKNIRAGAHYTQFMVYDLDGDGKAEIAMKTSDGTVDGAGTTIGTASADYRTSTGTILSGNEYLTVFNGQTGAAVTTIDYWPKRSVTSSWGDTYGNRSERMLAAIAYLDGVHPSLVMCRGYYTYAYLAAYNFNGKTLTSVWQYSSPYEAGLYGEGNHNLSVADLDGDGYDEIVYGSAALNHDGTLRYRTGLGHGDALHVSDMNPDLAGLETWDVHEETSATYSAEMRDGSGTELLTVAQLNADNGRGLAADIDSTYRGFEMWSAADGNVYNAVTKKSISTTVPSINFRVYWDGDLYDELFDGTSSDKGVLAGTGGKLEKWNGNGVARILNLYSVNSSTTNNSTKSNPCLIADLFGDFREEIIMRSATDTNVVNIIETNVTTPHRVYTLMSDPQYRESIAWQNVAYNQPPHLSYYLPDHADANASQPNIYVTGSSSSAATSSSSTVSSSSAAASSSSSTLNIVTKLDASAPNAGEGASESTNTGYEVGSAYYNFTNASGSYATWNITATSAGSVTLFLRYANGTAASADRAMTLTVNGTSYGSVTFGATANWTTWDIVSVTIELVAGENTITLTSATANGGPNIDYLGFDVSGISFTGTTSVAAKTLLLSAYWNSQNEFVAPVSGTLALDVFDLQGNRVASTSLAVSRGTNFVPFSGMHLGNGIYMIRSRLNGQSVGMFRRAIVE